MRLREDPLPSRKQGGPLDGQFGPTRLNQPPEAVQDVTVDQQASCGFSSAPAQRRIIPIQSVGLYGGLSCLHSSVASQLARSYASSLPRGKGALPVRVMCPEPLPP
jgi:hypothetical protein